MAGAAALLSDAYQSIAATSFVRAEPAHLERVLVFAGLLNYEEVVTLGPPVPGARLRRVFVEEGASVRAGARLLEFELGRLAADVERRRMAVRRAELTLQKRTTGQSDAIDVELAELDGRTAALELREALTAQSQLLIQAPYDGRVVQILRSNSGTSQPGVVVARGDGPVVDVELDEYEALDLRPNQAARVDVHGLRRTLQAQVAGTPKLRRLRAGGGVFSVVLRFMEPPAVLMAGMTATVSIVVATTDAAVVVPRRAIFTLDDKPHVLLKGPNGHQAVPVVLGVVTDDRAEIKQGVSSGSEVATGPEAELANAANVR
jgi:hypothetical protein